MTGLAWSAAAPPELVVDPLWGDDQERRYAWRTVALFVGLMVVVVAACGWMVGVVLVGAPPGPVVAAPAAAAPSELAPPDKPDQGPFVAPTQSAQHLLPAQPSSPPARASGTDAQYFAELNRRNLVITDSGLAVSTGHLVCRFRAGGGSDTQAAWMLVAKSGEPPLLLDQAWSIVGAAETVYCPELAG
jgi:hypothetical protein